MKTLKTAFLFLSLAYLSLYLPVAVVVYTPYWYKVNCGFHGRCDTVGSENAARGIDELVSYFRHSRRELNDYFWTDKEKNHLSEVRDITDNLALFGVIFLFVFLFTYDPGRIRRFCVANMVGICSLLLIVPFFGYFWRHVFHPLFFHNRNWLNTPRDFSYYIMPRVFFKYTLIYMIAASVLINVFLFLLVSYRKGLKYPGVR